MSQEQINMIGILYLAGMIVYALWDLLVIGNYNKRVESLVEEGKKYGVSKSIVIVIMIAVDTISILAWPIFMHIGIKERLRS